MKRLLLAIWLLAALPGLAMPAAAQADPKLYAVVFRVTPDGEGGIRDLRVESVIDPDGSGTPEEKADRPVDVPIPPSHLEAARRFLEGLERDRRSTEVYYTYTVYDPAHPERLDGK